MSGAASLPKRAVLALTRALQEFLAVPLAVTVGFIVLTAIVYWADSAWSHGRTPDGFGWLGELLGDSSSLASLLGTVASSIITVTSITFSLLLIAIQQGSSSMTAQVIDQFLMRVSNQLYFGYFIGLSVFVLLSLVTASSIHRPVFGTSLIILLTIVALCLIVVLIYNTIDQMRPRQVIRAIHEHVLKAREREAAWLSASRRQPRGEWPIVGTLRATEPGHIVSLDVAGLQDRLRTEGFEDLELQIHAPVGEFMAFGDPLATLRAPTSRDLGPDALERIRTALLDASAVDAARDLRTDPAYGIEQLKIIAWTSVSTAKSNPYPGYTVIQSLRDILARWGQQGGELAGDPRSMIVLGDAAPGRAMAALEELVVVASESMQPQTLTSALETLDILLETVPPAWRPRLAELARRSLSSLGEHVLTHDLERALAHLAQTLEATGSAAVAAEIRTATDILSGSNGTLNSRSTRVPT